MKLNNYLISVLLIIILFYTFNNNFKVFINTNYNKYSNILENRIIELHNKMLNSNKNINSNNTSNKEYNLNLFKNIYINEVSLIVIFTSILFLYIYCYNKYYLTVDNILIYIILITLVFYLIKN
jgi:hypothetical protein